jgi:hypothetical protein
VAGEDMSQSEEYMLVLQQVNINFFATDEYRFVTFATILMAFQNILSSNTVIFAGTLKTFMIIFTTG